MKRTSHAACGNAPQKSTAEQRKQGFGCHLPKQLCSLPPSLALQTAVSLSAPTEGENIASSADRGLILSRLNMENNHNRLIYHDIFLLTVQYFRPL